MGTLIMLNSEIFRKSLINKKLKLKFKDDSILYQCEFFD